jgi:hypothetical protein
MSQSDTRLIVNGTQRVLIPQRQNSHPLRTLHDSLIRSTKHSLPISRLSDNQIVAVQEYKSVFVANFIPRPRAQTVHRKTGTEHGIQCL